MKDNQLFKSHAKFIRLSPRKARLVVDKVRGLKALDALDMLKLMPQKASKEVYKVIKSATANAEHNFGISQTDLAIKEIKADQGPTFKRYKPRARGSADTITKKMTHLSVVLISTTGKKSEKPVSEPVKPEIIKEKPAKKIEEEEIKPLKTKSFNKKENKEKTKKQPEKLIDKDIKKESKESKVQTKPKIEKKPKIQPKQDHSFLGGLKNFFRRKGQ